MLPRIFASLGLNVLEIRFLIKNQWDYKHTGYKQSQFVAQSSQDNIETNPNNILFIVLVWKS